MLKVLAGDLSSTFNLDGGHLQRYLGKKRTIIRSLCDQLLLHDQILVPTNDYLTAAGLICILGERNVISLLEADQIRFVRLQGVLGYVRGTGPDGSLIAFEDPAHHRPQDAPIENSVNAALTVIADRLWEARKIGKLLVEKPDGVKTSVAVDAIRQDAYGDLRETRLWKDSYLYSNRDLLTLPGMKRMQVRVIGPGTKVSRNIVDALLALGLMNIELYLSEQFNCVSSSTASPIADCISLKLPRLDRDHKARPNIWKFLEVTGIPDVCDSLLADTNNIAEFIELTQGSNARQFRNWFHSKAKLSEREILQAYIEVLHQESWAQKAPGKFLRYAITTSAGFVPILGPIASAIDTFVVDKLLAGKSPKFFIQNLRNFSDQIKSR